MNIVTDSSIVFSHLGTETKRRAVSPAERKKSEPVKQPNMEVDTKKIVAELQKLFPQTKISYIIGDSPSNITVKVIDENTDKVIREIPTAELRKIQSKIKETLGLLFDISV